MTIVAYAAVSPGGRSFNAQLVCQERSASKLRRLCADVHEAGGLAGIQLTHAGLFADRMLSEDDVAHEQMSAQVQFNVAGLNFCRPMTDADRQHVVDSFVSAALVAVDSGFDCLEIHCGHGYLLSQCLSSSTNPGKSLEQRVHFPCQVLQAVRRAIGDRALIMVKMNAVDGSEDGLNIDESCSIAVEFSARCDVDILAISGGMILDNGLYMLRGDVPLKQMVGAQVEWMKKLGLLLFGPFFVPTMPFKELYFRDFARCILRVVQHANEDENTKTKICLIGGVHSLDSLDTAFHKDGFDFVQCGRALLYDPDTPRKWQDETIKVSPCTKCNLCIVDATMSQKPLACVVNKW